MPERIYTLVIKGKPEGPFSLEELKELEVNSDSFIRKPGMDDYKEAHEFIELREIFGFGKHYTAPQYFAGFDIRLLASVIDWFIIISVVLFLELIIVSIAVQQTRISPLLIFNVFIFPLVKLVYHLVLESWMQATLGKRLLNIKVTDLNGLKPQFNQILTRNLAKSLSTLIVFIGYLYSFLNKKHQCLHDVFAKTLVIKDRLI